MLNGWKENAATLIALLFAAFALSFSFPAGHQICSPNEYSHAKECAQYHLGPYVFLWIVDVADAHNGLLTAIATILIAGFTWTLRESSEKMWRATLIAAEAAQKSAESLPIIEGAYVYPTIVKTDIDHCFRGFKDTQVGQKTLSVQWEFKNFGKSPAIVHRLDAQFIHRRVKASGAIALGLAPVDRAIIGSQEGTGRQYAEIESFYRRDYETALTGESVLRFYGSIVYSDIFGDEWAFDFDWPYSPALGRFLPDNRPRRKTKKYVLNAEPGRYGG